MAKIEFKELRNYKSKSKDKDLNKSFRKEQSSKSYQQIGDLATGSSFFRYFPFSTAIKCLKEGTIAFVEPSRWNDANESLFYEADYSAITSNYFDHPRVFATCVTKKKYNEPSWRLYSGDDNLCVQFEIDRSQFRYEILKSLNPGDSIYEGFVQYISNSIIRSIGYKEITDSNGDKKPNLWYNKFIAPKGKYHFIENYLNLLLLKKSDFDHEHETRLFIVKKQDIDDKAEKAVEKRIEISDAEKREILIQRGDLLVLKNIEWTKILKGVTINEREGGYHYELLSEIVNNMIDGSGIDPSLKPGLKSTLKSKPYLVYGTKPDTLIIEG